MGQINRLVARDGNDKVVGYSTGGLHFDVTFGAKRSSEGLGDPEMGDVSR